MLVFAEEARARHSRQVAELVTAIHTSDPENCRKHYERQGETSGGKIVTGVTMGDLKRALAGRGR